MASQGANHENYILHWSVSFSYRYCFSLKEKLMKSWPNKEQLAHYFNVDYKGEFGAYGDDLLEAFEQLDEYELQQHILALWDIMSLFAEETDWVPVSKKERQRIVHASIQDRKIADNMKYIKTNGFN